MLAVLTPYGSDSVYMQWHRRLVEIARKWSAGTMFLDNKGLKIDESREKLVKDALEGGATEILFIDSDVIPPVNGYEMLKSHRYPIVSGAYRTKDGTGNLQAYLKNSRGQYERVSSIHGVGPAMADAVGLGFCWIDARVFRKLAEPWFLWGNQTLNANRVSEDLYFFQRVNDELDMRVIVDTRVSCLHMTVGAISDSGIILAEQIQ